MKIRKLLMFSAIFILTVIFCGSNVGAADVNTADSGVAYTVSEDGTYVIIVGYSDILPNVVIEPEIEGLPVKEISKSAFQNRPDIYSVTIPDSVEKIGEAAFRSCPNLRSVRLPSGLTELPFECFRDCKTLSSVTLPESLKEIGDYCFQNCTLLGKLKIPAAVKNIGYEAFLHCESIMLDCSENEYAKSYAEKFNVNTEFKGTTLYFLMVIGIVTLVAIAISAVILLLIRSHVKKHPDHDPSIYIEGFFAFVGRGLNFIFSHVKGFISAIVDFFISLFDKKKK